MNSFSEIIKNIPKNVKIIASLILIVLVAIIIIAVIVLNRKDPVDDSLVTVTNYDDTTNVPDDYKSVIENRIDAIIRTKSELSSLTFNDATIRDGSYKEESQNSATVANFLVDIDSLHYSFAVRVAWVDGKDLMRDPDVTITCPHYLDVIYKDKKCIAQPPREQLERYLPHYGKVNGVKYAVAYQTYVDKSYLRVEVPACNGQSQLDDAVADTKKWIKSLYLDPNDYEIGTINTCRN